MANKKGSDGRYRYRVCIGKDETGKPKYKSFYGSTAKAARAAAEAYRTALGKGMDPAQSKATLATLYDNLIAAKTAYQDDIAAGRTSDWTHLKGEAEALRALCYFDLIKHCGDVPYGYENNYVDDYGLTSRFDIYDALIEKLKAAEPYMYKVGEGGLNGERITRTFVDGLIGKSVAKLNYSLEKV